MAGNGIQAAEMACKNKYHLILMDMHIPGIDGLKATGLSKSLPKALNQTPSMAALTAQAYDSDRQPAPKAGLDFF
ncbi:chemotaxis protein CheY [Dethiosulfatarculus sandiegensis]|uniref:Chemotaxis protein CheY n=1 Tax=Dethiosulfatarculus sandiegensis TaxID=1429043 RepID=A0A0D2G7C3_9BACT|nr:chemotaxis protein CheY [Dethiosulfatarculus sandiegensis]